MTPAQSSADNQSTGGGQAQPSESSAAIEGVSVSGNPGAYQFSVTIRSPDTGCDQYADWWEVADESGQLLYRRILAHSHVDEQPFTRSGGPVPLQPGDTAIVRVHMNTSGYSQRAYQGQVTAEGSADFQAVTLAPDFAADLAQQDPLPTGCAF
ncbi:MAG: hypothetical protein WBA10_12885 [Elainellaceae cyanobacterium]